MLTTTGQDTRDAEGSTKFGGDPMALYLWTLALDGGDDDNYGDSDYGYAHLFGRRILRGDSQGFVWVDRHDTADEARETFDTEATRYYGPQEGDLVAVWSGPDQAWEVSEVLSADDGMVSLDPRPIGRAVDESAVVAIGDAMTDATGYAPNLWTMSDYGDTELLGAEMARERSTVTMGSTFTTRDTAWRDAWVYASAHSTDDAYRMAAAWCADHGKIRQCDHGGDLTDEEVLADGGCDCTYISECDDPGFYWIVEDSVYVTLTERPRVRR